MVEILYLVPFRQKSGVSLQNIAQGYVRTVGWFSKLDLRQTAWRSSIPLQYSRSGATLNNKYDNVCTTPVPYDMNTIYHKELGIESPTSPRWSLICLCYILRYSQTAQHFNFVRRSGGTVIEDKLRVLSISQSESGPYWWSQIRLAQFNKRN